MNAVMEKIMQWEPIFEKSLTSLSKYKHYILWFSI